MQIRFRLEGQNIIKTQQKDQASFHSSIFVAIYSRRFFRVYPPPPPSPLVLGGGGAEEGGRAQGEHLSAALRRSVARLIEFTVENGGDHA